MKKRILFLGSLVFCSTALAQTFPDGHPVRIVVPFTPAGTTDTIARAVGEKLSKKWGVPVVVDNRPGAGSTLGSDIVAKAQPDGHTILLAVTAHSINPTVMKSLPYDTVKDFAPLTLIARAPNLLAVGPTIQAKTVPEFIDYLKKNPGKLNAGSHGVGNMSHLVAEMFKLATGTDFTVVQYKGAQPATLALMSGQVDFMFDTGTVIPALKTSKVRVIGTTGKQRAAFFPDVPTFIESGLKDFEAESWYGFLTTGGTPEPVVRQLSAALIEALQAPDVRERIMSVNMEPVAGSSEAFDQLIKSQIKRWETTIKEAGMVFE